MKNCVRIALTELKQLFYSPVAWLTLIVFTIQSSGVMAEKLTWPASVGQFGTKDISNFTEEALMHADWGFFIVIQKMLYLYIPLLTMSLFSKEQQSGSIKLLLSSPVKISQVVFGKYMAMLSVALLLMMVIVLELLAFSYSVTNIDYQLTFSAMLGLWLLICTYAAIGLFMSSITKYQIVAAISTLSLLAGLDYVREVAQQYDLVRQVTYLISMSGRSLTFYGGLINTRDAVYFLVIISLFLGWVIIRLLNQRDATSRIVKAFRFASYTSLLLVIAWISAQPHLTLYRDMTRNNSRSLSADNVKVLKSIPAPLTVNAYVNILDASGHFGLPEYRNAELDFWDTYRRYRPDMQLKYTLFYDSSTNMLQSDLPLHEQARQRAIMQDMDIDDILTPIEIKKIVDLSADEWQTFYKLKSGEYEASLHFFTRPPRPFEAEVMAAMKKLITKSPVIGFLIGHQERSIRKKWPDQYYDAVCGINERGALINQGFDVKDVKLTDSISLRSLNCLVIADPITPFTESELSKLSDYIDSGGNMLIAGEPGRQQLFDLLLQNLGVAFMTGQLTENSKDYSPAYIQASFTRKARVMTQDLRNVEYSGLPVVLDGAVGITEQRNVGFSIDSIVTINNNSWNENTAYDAKKTTPSFDSSKDQSGPIAPVVALYRNINGRHQKIAIIGDADFMTNAKRMNPGNSLLVRGIFKWFANNVFPVNENSPQPEKNETRIKMKELDAISTIVLGVCPAILLLTGASILFVRTRR